MENVRRVVRRVLGNNSAAYQAIARSVETVATLRSEGLGGYRALRRIAKTPARSSEAVAFESRQLEHPIYLRPNTHDVDSVMSTVIRADCGKFKPSLAPKTIIDAGAYIGDSTVYFLNTYPGSTVIAVEPDPESAAMARRNVEAYGARAEIVEAAVTADGGTVYLSGFETGANVNSESGRPVPSCTVPDLIAKLPGGRVDLLKLDIEGAEDELFQKNPEAWLSNVGYLIVETHGEAITRNVLGVLNKLGWNCRSHRTQNFCTPPV